MLENKPISHENRIFLSKTACGYKNGKVLVCCAAETDIIICPVQPTKGNELPKPGECGFTFQDKILGGDVTKISDFPWMALLQYTYGNGAKGFHCGGVLINQKYVLTASHVSFFNNQSLVNRIFKWNNIFSVLTEKIYLLIGL